MRQVVWHSYALVVIVSGINGGYGIIVITLHYHYVEPRRTALPWMKIITTPRDAVWRCYVG